jgi:hypothetical protein
MATESAELIAKLSLDNARFKKQLKEAKDKLKEFGDQAEDSGEKAKDGFDKAEKGASGFSKVAKSLGPIIGAAFAADTIIGFGKAVISTTAEFQKMEAVLTNTLGSSSAARSAMDQIVQFAATTPFSVNELTESFVKLANRGFVPTANEMRSLGDLASSTGKSFDQLTEAALDAMTGEFERLKEFGITAQSEGDRVKFTFKGVTTEVEKTDKALKSYILSLGNVEGVSGAMAAMSGTLGNKISALDDNITQLKLAIGNSTSGVFGATIDWLNEFTAKAVMAAKSIRQIRDAVISTQDASDTAETRKEVEFLVEKLSKTLPIQEAINRAVDLTKQSYKNLSNDISKGVITYGKLTFTLNQLEKIRIDLLKEQKKETGQLTEEEKKRLEANQKFYKSAIDLSTQYQEALKAEYSSINLMTDATSKLATASESLAKSLTPKGIIDVGVNLDEPVLSAEDAELIKQNQEEVDKFNQKVALTQTLTSMLGSTFQSAFEGMLNTGKISFKGIIDGLKALIIKLIAAAGAALALNVLLGGIGLAGGKFGGMEGFKALFSSLSGIPKFAEGGMVTGMTMAVLGDNPSKKEAIIPFEKMGSFLSQYGTGGNVKVEVIGSLRGEDIFFSGVNYQNGRNKIIAG